LINDIDMGLPVDNLDEQRKQDCYVNYHHKYFQGLNVVTDTSVAGFIDLVPSDKVKLSVNHGVIAGMADLGLLDIVQIPTGALKSPNLATVTQDTGDTYDVTLTGTHFTSYAPYVTKVSLTDGTTVVEITSKDVLDNGGSFSDTEIVIPAALHGFATDGSEDVVSATVTNETGSSTTAV
jgi:hypothetical protein